MSVYAAPASPLWPSELTAWGTLAVAIVAVSVALFAELRTTVRVRKAREETAQAVVDERAHAARALAEERAAADKRLQRQLDASAVQLRDEREAARVQEQLVEAYAVQVVVAEKPAGQATGNVQQPISSDVKNLAIMVVNRGRFAITEIEAQISGDGHSLFGIAREERFGGYDSLPTRLKDTYAKLGNPVAQGNVLGPRDTDIGMRFETGLVPEHGIAWPGPYAVVRWRDRWGQKWEHKKGTVRSVNDGEPWLP
jgi:hypothetical protein